MNEEQVVSMLNRITGTIQGANLTGNLRQGGAYLRQTLEKLSALAMQKQWIDEDAYQLLGVADLLRSNDTNMDEVAICASLLASAISNREGLKDKLRAERPPQQFRFGGV